jgi:hypothetical protein
MNSQDFRNLQESYLNVYENEQLDEMPYRVVTKNDGGEEVYVGGKYATRKTARTKVDKEDEKVGGYRHSIRKVDEAKDIFDYIMEYLISEGYVDTLQGAEQIISVMSEDWKCNILEAKVDDDLSPEEKENIRNKRSDGQSTFTRRNLTRVGRGKSPKGMKPPETTTAMTSMRKYEMALNQPNTRMGRSVRDNIAMDKAERGPSGRRGS